MSKSSSVRGTVSVRNPATGLTASMDSAARAVRLQLGGGMPTLSVRPQWSAAAASGSVELPLAMVEAPACRPLPQPTLVWEDQCQAPGLRLEYSLCLGRDAAWSVRVTNVGTETLTLRWRLQLAGLPTGARLFGPCGSEFFDPGQPVRVGYRESGFGSMTALSLPLATVFREADDIGISFAGHFEMPLPPFALELEAGRTRGELVRTILALQAAESRTVTTYLIGHAGCWRPGLAWVREKFSRYFTVSDAVVRRTHGCYASSNVADAALCQRFAREGVKNLEIHYTYPHLGKYVPDEEPWVPAVDDKWTIVKHTSDPQAPAEDAPYETLRDYLRRVVRPVGTTARIRDLLRHLRAAGIQSFYYFQPTEAWEFFAASCFPEAILRHADGSPRLTWYDTVQIDCRPGTRWSQYIARQLEQVFDLYPEVDGIFMDQSAVDDNDYRVCRIADLLGRSAARRGKLCYWNGPFLVELVEHAVGMLAEDGAVEGGMIKYLTIGNKVCCGRGSGEALYQRNLLNGLWPSAPSMHHYYSYLLADEPATDLPIPAEKEQLHRQYLPLFEHYVGKTWVLDAHALKLPPGLQGNLFRRPNGDLLVPLVVPQHSSGDGRYLESLEFAVRTAGTDAVRCVSLLTPDLAGRYALPWQRRDGGLHVELPWLNSAALIVLSREPLDLPGLPVHEPARQVTGRAAPRLMAATLRYEGLIPTGAASKLFSGLRTTAPLPAVPVRRIRLNGQPVGALTSRNYRKWRPGFSVALTGHAGVEATPEHADLAECLQAVNELEIEPAAPDDFFALGKVRLTVLLADGRRLDSELVAGPWSSCPDPRAVGQVGAPIRIRFTFPREQLDAGG